MVYIIGFAGQRARVAEGQARANQAKNYLTQKRGIDPRRIVIVDGGYRDPAGVELFIIERGQPKPLSSPNLSPGNVKIIKDDNASSNHHHPSRRSTRDVVIQMKSIIVLASLLVMMSLALTQDAPRWRGIVPLHSTRAQLEQLVGVLDMRCQCYSTETESIRVEYASGPCTGALAGWNVPADTVLSLQVYPKKPLLLSELKIHKEDFITTVDDTVTTYYANGEKGLRYSVKSSGAVESVWYGPSIKQNKLRCAGFPPTDGGITAYRPYYEFPFETVADVNRLAEFGVRLLKEPQLKGYIIVYGQRDKVEAVDTFVKSAKAYLVEDLKINPNTVETSNGGFREYATVELFLIPREWPPPIPTPTYSSIR